MSIEAVTKMSGEVAKEVPESGIEQRKNAIKDLDRPLNAMDVNETSAKEILFKDKLSDLDKTLNYNNQMKPDISKEVDSKEKIGGRFGDVFKEGEGATKEVHHMPPDSVTDLERNDGPAIKMDKEEHRLTASCGNSREAREYRGQQKLLISEGKFDEALQMDIEDIQEKFGDKYDDAISQMMEYVDELKENGRI